MLAAYSCPHACELMKASGEPVARRAVLGKVAVDPLGIRTGAGKDSTVKTVGWVC